MNMPLAGGTYYVAGRHVGMGFLAQAFFYFPIGKGHLEQAQLPRLGRLAREYAQPHDCSTYLGSEDARCIHQLTGMGFHPLWRLASPTGWLRASEKQKVAAHRVRTLCLLILQKLYLAAHAAVLYCKSYLLPGHTPPFSGWPLCQGLAGLLASTL